LLPVAPPAPVEVEPLAAPPELALLVLEAFALVEVPLELVLEPPAPVAELAVPVPVPPASDSVSPEHAASAAAKSATLTDVPAFTRCFMDSMQSKLRTSVELARFVAPSPARHACRHTLAQENLRVEARAPRHDTTGSRKG
jgi:hypothetical protein